MAGALLQVHLIAAGRFLRKNHRQDAARADISYHTLGDGRSNVQRHTAYHLAFWKLFLILLFGGRHTIVKEVADLVRGSSQSRWLSGLSIKRAPAQG